MLERPPEGRAHQPDIRQVAFRQVARIAVSRFPAVLFVEPEQAPEDHNSPPVDEMPIRHVYAKILCEHLIPAVSGRHPECDGKDNPNDEIFAVAIAASARQDAIPVFARSGYDRRNARRVGLAANVSQIFAKCDGRHGQRRASRGLIDSAAQARPRVRPLQGDMAGNIHPVALTPKPDLNASLLIVVSRNPEPERLTEMLLRTILWLYFVMLALSLLTDPSVIAAPF